MVGTFCDSEVIKSFAGLPFRKLLFTTNTSNAIYMKPSEVAIYSVTKDSPSWFDTDSRDIFLRKNFEKFDWAGWLKS